MREILFRGKTLYEGEWITGYLSKEPADSNYYIQPVGKNICDVVNPETVGQFTELTDCLNNAMYEGDLVRAFDDKECEFDKSFIGIVKFMDGAFGVEWHFIDFQTFMPFRNIGNKIMVVGNIFDNPEMLKCETPLENYIDRICLMCSKKCNEYLESGVDLYKHKVRILRDENRELKKLLKLAIEDFDTLYDYELVKCSSDFECKYCPFCTRDINSGLYCCNEWKYKEEAEKLLEGDNK